MKSYNLKIKFVFFGDVTVKAKNRAEAEKIILENVWARQAKFADNEYPQIEDYGIDCTSESTEIVK